MKIAVLSPIAWRTPPEHYGPWEQMASNLTEQLVLSGHEVTLFATADSITKAKLLSVIDKGYEVDRHQDAKVIECLHISHFMEMSNKFDILHNHFDFLPLTYTQLISTPMVTTIHGFSSEKIIPVYQKYNNNNYYVSISNANRHQLLDYAATIYNGLNVEDFKYNEYPQDYLLFMGRIHPDKGTAEAIDIAKAAGKKLLIAGIIQDEGYFNQKIKPQLNESIKFIGHVGPKQRNELLGNALALLHLINFDEPFGLSVVEAMLCGTPVIAINRGSMKELILDGNTGFLVNDSQAALKAIQRIGQIDRKTCVDHAKSKFSAQKMAEDYVSLYQRILNC